MYKTTFLISINLFFLTTCYSSSPSNEDSNVYVGNNKRYVTGTLQVKWFDQKLNHFDRSPNATTWKQVQIYIFMHMLNLNKTCKFIVYKILISVLFYTPS